MKNNEFCTPSNIKLKSNFLGPKAENGNWLEKNIVSIFSKWCNWRRYRFPEDGRSISSKDMELDEFKIYQDKIFELQDSLSKRFEKEVPKYSPRYLGHMVSEISLPALFGHLIALIHNPNNTSKSAARVGSEIEDEAINSLSEMIGFSGDGVGHLTSGGTIANLEGLWRARFRLDHNLSLGAYLVDKGSGSVRGLFNWAHISPCTHEKLVEKYNIDQGKMRSFSLVENGAFEIGNLYSKLFDTPFLGPIVLIPGHKHFSWQKAMSIMGLGKQSLWQINLNSKGQLCLKDLRVKIEKAKKENRPILAVISVAGTTELGMVDPVCGVQDLLDDLKGQEGIHIWHHVDAAYGGIYASMGRGEEFLEVELDANVMRDFNSMKRAESITLDPHKLALVPYACGAIILKNDECNKVTSFLAPYLNESKTDSGKWPVTIEGSRPATGACATWMVSKSLGLNKMGMGKILSLGIAAKFSLEKKLMAISPEIRILPSSDTNIVSFAIAFSREKNSVVNNRMRRIYNHYISSEEFSVSQTALSLDTYSQFLKNFVSSWEGEFDDNNVFLIRMVMMNPFILSRENQTNILDEFCTSLKNIIHSEKGSRL
jgi:glutamate/tyrosine decarboxylase-like PLP-dependent enzyme